MGVRYTKCLPGSYARWAYGPLILLRFYTYHMYMIIHYTDKISKILPEPVLTRKGEEKFEKELLRSNHLKFRNKTKQNDPRILSQQGYYKPYTGKKDPTKDTIINRGCQVFDDRADREYYTVTLQENGKWALKCTCNYMDYDGIPCRHILFAAVKAKINVQKTFHPLCDKKYHYIKYKQNMENALSRDFYSAIPPRWTAGNYELNLQRLLHDPDQLDTCNKILPTYKGFLFSFNKEGLQKDDLKEWDEDVFKNRLQGRGKKRKRGAMDVVSTTKRRNSSDKWTPGPRNRSSPLSSQQHQP